MVVLDIYSCWSNGRSTESIISLLLGDRF